MGGEGGVADGGGFWEGGLELPDGEVVVGGGGVVVGVDGNFGDRDKGSA